MAFARVGKSSSLNEFQELRSASNEQIGILLHSAVQPLTDGRQCGSNYSVCLSSSIHNISLINQHVIKCSQLCLKYWILFWDYFIFLLVRIVAKSTLREFWAEHQDAEEPLLAWYREVEKGDWSEPAHVKAKYGNASILRDNRVVFNIKGNDYRLIVKINYPYRMLYVRFVGTHKEYDGVNAEEI